MRQRLDRILEIVLAILLAFMTLDVLLGVFTRYVLNSQSEWTDEMARYLMIWVSILGAAYASGKNMHISIDLLPQYLPAHRRKWLFRGIYATVILFVLAVFVIGGLRYTYISFKLGQVSPALGLPVGYIYLILPLAGCLIIYYKSLDLIRTFSPKQNDEWK